MGQRAPVGGGTHHAIRLLHAAPSTGGSWQPRLRAGPAHLPHLSRPTAASATSTEQLARQATLRMPAPNSASGPGPSRNPGFSPQAPASVETLPSWSTSRMQAFCESATTSPPAPGRAQAAVGELNSAWRPGPSRYPRSPSVPASSCVSPACVRRVRQGGQAVKRRQPSSCVCACTPECRVPAALPLLSSALPVLMSRR